jgi:flagellin-like hook-associated protein FlgL
VRAFDFDNQRHDGGSGKHGGCMSVTSVSNLSIVRNLTSALQGQQGSLSDLSNQLSTQKKHSDLTDYSANDARNLVDLQAAATQSNAYVNVIATASTNLSIYDTTLTDLESIISQAYSLANNNPTYGVDVASNVLTQTNNYLKSVTVDLNQTVNGRYIYSGSRYHTQSVKDLSELPTTTLDTTIYDDDSTLPSYDYEYVEGASPASESEEAYTTDQAMIDNGYVVDYGITSNDPAIQKAVMGLRYLQAAGKATDNTTYQSYMTQASSLLASALSQIQNLHTSVANNINVMASEKTAQQTAISNLTDRVTNIQQVDTTEIATEITSLEAILQASYSVTGSILKMSIINYL